MTNPEAADITGVFGLIMLVGFWLVYYVAHAVSELIAKIAGRKLISHRLFGCLTVILATAIVSGIALESIFDPQIYASLSGFDRGYYWGRIAGIPFGPALAVLLFVGVRAWAARISEARIRRADLAHKKQMRVEPTFRSDPQVFNQEQP